MRIVLALLLLAAKPSLDPKLWLPKKKGVLRLKHGQLTKVNFADLDKGAQLIVKGPGVIVCEARRSDLRNARVDLELPGVVKDLVNLYADNAAGLTHFAVPEGLHTIEVALFAPDGAAGWAKLGYQLPGYLPPPPPAAPAAAPLPAPEARAPTLPTEVAVTSKSKLRAIAGEPVSVFVLTPASPLQLRVVGPLKLVVEVRRHLPKQNSSIPSRVLVSRDGETIASALFEQEMPDKTYADPPLVALSAMESFELDVPVGTHAIAFKTTDPRGLAASFRTAR